MNLWVNSLWNCSPPPPTPPDHLLTWGLPHSPHLNIQAIGLCGKASLVRTLTCYYSLMCFKCSLRLWFSSCLLCFIIAYSWYHQVIPQLCYKNLCFVMFCTVPFSHDNGSISFVGALSWPVTTLASPCMCFACKSFSLSLLGPIYIIYIYIYIYWLQEYTNSIKENLTVWTIVT